MSVGELKVYWGSMFSGKTTRLINDLMFAGTGAICFKPMRDDRDEDVVRTHDGLEFPVVPIEEASEILYLLEPSITTIGIEEASLFLGDPTLVPTIKKLRAKGFNVIVTGLDLTSEDVPFGQMPTIAAIADECIKFRSKCVACGNKSSISFFKGIKKGVVKVGGSEKYAPLCRTCYSYTLN